MQSKAFFVKVLRRLPEGEFQAVTAGDGTRSFH